MPEMIRYLTKKFSTHSLTEVKPAEQFSLQVRASVLSLDHLEEQVCVCEPPVPLLLENW